MSKAIIRIVIVSVLVGLSATGCANTRPQFVGLEPAANAALGGKAKATSLLYVVMRKGVVDVLSYPSCKEIGTLKSAAHTSAPITSDPANGNVLINVGATLDEFAHGGQKPIAQIHPTPSYGIAGHYAFDSSSGNIAVSFQSGFGSKSGTVAIYPTATSEPSVYTVPGMSVPESLGYDGQGNLFVDGNNNEKDSDLLAELPKGAQQFQEVSLGTTSLTNMGSIQWDGTYITLADGNTIYQLEVSDSSATVVGKTTLAGAWANEPDFWIQGNTVLGAHLSRTHVHNGRLLGLWHYPQGGNAYKTVNLSQAKTDTVASEAVSVAPAR